jgi:integrase
MKVQDVTVGDVADFLAQLQRDGYSGHTARAILTPLSRCLATATREGIIPANPVAKLDKDERPKLRAKPMRILDSAEIKALLAEVPERHRAMFAVCLFAGPRRGEVLGLRWADLDFDAQTLAIRSQLDDEGGYADPKTDAGIREVDLAPFVVVKLREHWLRTPLPLRRPDARNLGTPTRRSPCACTRSSLTVRSTRPRCGRTWRRRMET